MNKQKNSKKYSMMITMIKITHLQTKKAEVSWETGNDFVFLQNLKHLIEIRNKDKEQITELKEAYK